MKLLIAVVFAAGVAAPALAASSFDGTWKGDVASYQPPSKIVHRMLKDGRYKSDASVPAIDIAADGKFHPVKGDPYEDEHMVLIVDKSTIKQEGRKRGKPIASSTMTVSPDGKTMTQNFVNMTAPGGTVTGEITNTRVGAAPTGSHAMSGAWKPAALVKQSENALEVTLKDTGKTLSISSPTGVGYTAAFGGPAVPLAGDPGKVMITVKRRGPNAIVETDSRAGKVISIVTMTLSADGKSLTFATDDKENGTTSQWTTHRK